MIGFGSKDLRGHRLRLTVVVAGGVAALALATTQFAAAHIADSTGGITHDLYTPAGQARCIYGPGNCATHSFSFVSANDIGGANYVCAEVWASHDHGLTYSRTCEWDFARTCFRYTHSPGGPLHCNDEDGWSFHAGAQNNSGPGTTIRRHGVY